MLVLALGLGFGFGFRDRVRVLKYRRGTGNQVVELCQQKV